MSARNKTDLDDAAVFASPAWLSGMPIAELLQCLRRDFSLAAPIIWIEQFYAGMENEALKIGREHIANQGLGLWINMWTTPGSQ